VLHPLTECIGRPCTVEHADGAIEQGVFPQYISPHQPFKNIRAISHEIAPGLKAEVRFAGEIFEMEDQRNWTDASFKTYCTPLELPFPVLVEKGTRVSQSVRAALIGAPIAVCSSAENDAVEMRVARQLIRPRPPIGLGVASHGQPLTAGETARLKLLKPDHLRVDLPLAEAAWWQKLVQATDQARQVGTTLHLALFFSANLERELEVLAASLAEIQPPVSLWLLFPVDLQISSQNWLRVALPKLHHFGAAVPVATGTNAYFVALNRNRSALDPATLPCYSVNPQVHTFDNFSLVENLGAQASTVETARQFSQRPVVVSPITLRPRFNPNATAASAIAMGALPPGVDARQMSLVGAGWTLGSVAQLSATGHVYSLTYYETIGWRGVMETAVGSPQPELFPSLPGMVFPVYHLLADLAGFDRICPVVTSDPLRVAGLALYDGTDQCRILIANLLAEPAIVKLGTTAAKAAVRCLDQTNVEEAMQAPETWRSRSGETVNSASGLFELKLLPCALARVDIA
jgi:hypothetical protein